MSSDIDTITTCAACGKEGDTLKSCVACKMVKYCNRDCQTTHRPLHKKECKKRAAELYDEKLFKGHPSEEDCPICTLPMLDLEETAYKSCCSKVICKGCNYAMVYEAHFSGGKIGICPFCREQTEQSDEGEIRLLEKHMKSDDAFAFSALAGYYKRGERGVPQDEQKASELYLKAGELGCAASYFNLSCHYRLGTGVERDTKKAMHFLELAAMKGSIHARHNLGGLEAMAGNNQQAMKHLLISVSAGHTESLDGIKQGYIHGLVSKHDYAQALRAYQNCRDEANSDMRDKAALARV